MAAVETANLILSAPNSKFGLVFATWLETVWASDEGLSEYYLGPSLAFHWPNLPGKAKDIGPKLKKKKTTREEKIEVLAPRDSLFHQGVLYKIVADPSDFDTIRGKAGDERATSTVALTTTSGAVIVAPYSSVHTRIERVVTHTVIEEEKQDDPDVASRAPESSSPLPDHKLRELVYRFFEENEEDAVYECTVPTRISLGSLVDNKTFAEGVKKIASEGGKGGVDQNRLSSATDGSVYLETHEYHRVPYWKHLVDVRGYKDLILSRALHCPEKNKITYCMVDRKCQVHRAGHHEGEQHDCVRAEVQLPLNEYPSPATLTLSAPHLGGALGAGITHPDTNAAFRNQDPWYHSWLGIRKSKAATLDSFSLSDQEAITGAYGPNPSKRQLQPLIGKSGHALVLALGGDNGKAKKEKDPGLAPAKAPEPKKLRAEDLVNDGATPSERLLAGAIVKIMDRLDAQAESISRAVGGGRPRPPARTQTDSTTGQQPGNSKARKRRERKKGLNRASSPAPSQESTQSTPNPRPRGDKPKGRQPRRDGPRREGRPNQGGLAESNLKAFGTKDFKEILDIVGRDFREKVDVKKVSQYYSGGKLDLKGKTKGQIAAEAKFVPKPRVSNQAA